MSDYSQIYRDMLAPGAEVIEAIASEVMGHLPDPFHGWLTGVAVRVEDFPDDEVMDALSLESPYDLLGLYHGTAIGDKTSDILTTGPDVILLFRRPILDYWSEREDTLSAIVTHVLIHEIGHHFGLSDDDMDRIEKLVADNERGVVH